MPKLYGRQWSKQELLKHVGDISQIAGVDLLTFEDGAPRGVRLARFRTGSGLDFDVLLDRGMDIGRAAYRGEALAWQSATGPIAPAFFEPEGAGWLRGFHGGLVTTCGLTYLGAPCVDEGVSLGAHGRASYTPAEGVWVDAAWQGDEYVMWAQGRLREAAVFGENIRMHRRIWTRLGENRIYIDDVVENLGDQPAPHMLLYHINIGFPVLAEGSRVVIPSRRVTPRDADAERELERWNTVEAPTSGYREAVFYHDVVSRDGYATAGIVGGAGQSARGVVIRFSHETLPRLIQWKMIGCGLYVVGLEPANCLVEGRAKERARGTLVYLQPGERREYRVEIAVLTSNEEARAWEASVTRES